MLDELIAGDTIMTSNRLVGRRVMWATIQETPDDAGTELFEDGGQRRELKRRAKQRYKDTYGFDPLTMMLFSIMVQIAIKLIMKWIQNRKKASELKAACQQPE